MCNMTRTAMLLLLSLPILPVVADASCSARSGRVAVPLVELYTAEGCSDCPPADAWLSRLAARTAPDAASFLALHTDYWDSIGWRDRFASGLNGQRHELRTRLANGRTVYTPQVMVGRETTVDWRDVAEVERLLAHKAGVPVVDLAMDAEVVPGGLQVAFEARPVAASAAEGPVWVWLALYQDGLISEIDAGENRNLTLHHDRVARFLRGPWNLGGREIAEQVLVPLQVDVDLGRSGLLLFAEAGRDGSGLQSLGLPLSCLEAQATVR